MVFPGRRYVSIAVVGAAGVALSIGLFVFVDRTERANQRVEFEARARERATALEGRIETYVGVLHALRALYAASVEVDRNEFRHFADELIRLHPDIDALEWVPRVTLRGRPALEASARRDGLRDFQIFERNPEGRLVPAAPRAEYFPVYFVEPLAANRAVLGFDLASSAPRRAALEHAAATGALVATSRLQLVQERAQRIGVLLVLPVYRGGSTPADGEARRAGLLGFVLATVRVGDLVAAVARDFPGEPFDTVLVDESASVPEQVLHRSRSPSPDGQVAAPGDFAWRTAFEVGGRRWSVMFTPANDARAARRAWEAWLVLAAMLGLTAATTAWVGSLVSRTAVIEHLVGERTAALSASLRETGALLAIARVVGGSTDVIDGLRRICRELAILTAAETVSVHLADPATDELRPAAGYHVPREMLDTLATVSLPLSTQGFTAEVFREGRILWTDDVPANPRFAGELFRRFPHQSGAVIPLVLDDAVAGVFYLVWWRERRSFAEAELATLRAIGAQVGALLRNARLTAEQERLLVQTRLQEREALALEATAREIALSRDRRGLTRRIVDRTRELTGADVAFLAPWQRDAGAAIVRDAAGAGDAALMGRAFTPGAGLEGAALETGTVVHTTDDGTDPRPERAPRADGFLAQAVAPLRAAGTVSGLLSIANRSARPFTAGQIACLARLADQAAIALENADLYDALTRRATRLRGLARLNQLVSSSLDMNAVLHAIARAAAELVTAPVASFWIADAAARTLTLRAFSDEAIGADFPIRTLRYGEAGVGWTAVEQRALSVDDVFSDPRFVAGDWWQRHGLSSFYALPVVVQGSLLAVLALNGRQPFRFGADDEEMLAAFVAQAGVALDNARHYADTRSHLAVAALLNEAAQAVHLTLDVRARLPEALEQLAGTFGAAGGGVVLFGATAAPIETVHWGRWPEGASPAFARLLARRSEPLVVDEIATRPDLFAPNELGYDLSGAAALPMRSRQGVVGALALVFEDPRALDEIEVRLLTAYANQLALALENTRLFGELEGQRRRLEQIFAATSDGILVLDFDRQVTALNRQGASLLRVAAEDVVGRPVAALVARIAPAVMDPPIAELAARLDALRPPASGEVTLSDTPPRILRWHATTMRTAEGRGVGITITFTDVTREREIDRMKDEFLATVSHELRTPLTAIQGHLELVLDGDAGPTTELQRRFLGIATQNAIRLGALISDLLDAEKIEAGAIGLRREPVDLASVLADVVATFGVEAERKGLRLSIDTPSALPVTGDRDRLVQVFANLVSNAIKYTPAGAVRVRAGAAQGTVEAAVEDTGIGLTPDERAHVFTRFFRGTHRTVRETRGTGLGLAITRGIVEGHGGTITLDSEPGRGSTFVVRLPAREGP